MDYIKNIFGGEVEVTDLDKAIEQAELSSTSHYRTPNGLTVGEWHSFLLVQ